MLCQGISMKKLVTLLLALILSLPLAVRGQSIQPAKGFNGKVMDATFALYGHMGDKKQFLCTVWNYKQIDGGYDMVSAGHCVAENPPGVTYSVEEQIDGKDMPVSLMKYELDAAGDFSLFELKTTKVYPVLDLGTVTDQSIGDKVINPNFAAGVGKQLSLGAISTDVLKSDPASGDVDVFWAQVFGAGGSSGSPVISDKTHKVIGVLIYGLPDPETGSELNVGHGVEPIDKFAAFLAKPFVPPATISDQEFHNSFGPEHPFMLVVHGVNPVFPAGNRMFKIDTFGLELSDEYYYNVPVYIDKRDDGYWLVSTKDAPYYGVGVKLIS
jgi:hypothetical protein